MAFKNTLKTLIAMLNKRSISSVELTQLYLDRIAQYNKKLNCYLNICADTAILNAKKADKTRENTSNTNENSLLGIPIAYKDIFCTQGIPTTCGSHMLENFTPPYNATVVDKLDAAGCILLGKTNMDEFAMGSSNENSYFGPCLNPWNHDYVSGGSSGGSAVAVAARLCGMALGTDTGGSIRQPAAFCGITGLKPTYGLVSRRGMIAFSSSLDQAGPMTTTVEDSAIVLNAISGHDPHDMTSSHRSVPDYTKNLNQNISGKVVGLPKEYFTDDLDSSIRKIMDETIKELVKLGAEIKEISLPNTKYCVPVYYTIAPSECSSNLARFDGVRYGLREQTAKDLKSLYTESRGQGFGEEVKRRILLGTFALSSGFYDAYYLKAQKIRTLIYQDFQNVFSDVDVILGPTVPSTAFKIGENTSDPMSMYLSDIYTISVNLAGLPALSMPAGFSNGFPVGVQLIANKFSEEKLLNIGHKFQQATDWHLKVPTQYQT